MHKGVKGLSCQLALPVTSFARTVTGLARSSISRM